jgi:hypothetical protein
MDKLNTYDTATAGSRLWKGLIPPACAGFLVRCSSPGCSFRLKVQPAVMARFRGLHFRTRWYHNPSCLLECLTEVIKQMLPSVAPARQRPHRMPIGLLLLQRGAITGKQLREALRLQRSAGSGKLGYWLQQIAPVDEDQICAALAQQWACPVFPLHQSGLPSITADAPPYPLLVAAKAVPVFSTIDGRQRHIAFSERVDHTLLYALEEILTCQTVPCISRESAVAEALEHFRKYCSGNLICFGTVRDPLEVASTICSYAGQMGIREVKIVPAISYLWAVLLRKAVRWDLLFRMSSAAFPGFEENVSPQIKAFPQIADTTKDGVADALGPL